MSEFKGTKGEWKYSIHNGRIIFNKPNMDLWFHDEDNGFKESPSEVLANAKLIAAAPELLNSLMNILSSGGQQCLEDAGFENEVKEAQRVIEKALK